MSVTQITIYLFCFLGESSFFIIKKALFDQFRYAESDGGLDFNAKIKCSANAIGTYRNGYFKGNDFKYHKWLISSGEPPKDTVQKDQSSMDST